MTGPLLAEDRRRRSILFVIIATLVFFPKLFQHYLFPHIVVPYHIPLTGVLGNAAVSGVNALTGLLRSLLVGLLLLLLLKVGLSGRATPSPKNLGLVWTFFVACAFLFLTPDQRLFFAQGAIGVFLLWLVSAEKYGGDHSLALMVCFSGFSAAAYGLFPAKSLSWAGVHTVIGCSGAAFGICAGWWLRGEKANSWKLKSTAWVALFSSLLYFSQWPRAALPLTTLFFAFLFYRYLRLCSDKPANFHLSLIWSVALPCAIIGACGQPNLWALPIDFHHEAEYMIPAWNVISGKLPFRDFSMMHGVGIDLLPGLLAELFFGFSLSTTRLLSCLLVPALRALSILGILNLLLKRRSALVVALIIFSFGYLTGFATNDYFRMEPWLLVSFCYLHYFCTGRARSLAACAALTPLLIFLTPELGSGFAAGLLLALALGWRFHPLSRKEVGLSTAYFFVATLLLVTVALLAGILPGFLHSFPQMADMSRHLIARWEEQNPFHPTVLAHLFCIAVGFWFLMQKGWRSRDGGMILPFLATACLVAYGTFSDDPDRVQRTVLVDAIILVIAFSRSPGLRVFLFPSLVFLLAAVCVTKPNLRGYFSQRVLGPIQSNGHLPRTGPLASVNTEPIISLVKWNNAHKKFANLSGSELDALWLEGGGFRPFIPLHAGFQPADQTRMLNGIIERQPPSLLYRNVRDLAFWQTTPYNLLFHTLDAYVLAHYENEGMAGPYVALKKAVVTEQTLGDLFPEALDYQSNMKRAPFHFGELGARGVRRVAQAYPRQKWWWWEVEIVSSDPAAYLRISARPGHRGKTIKIAFTLKNDGQRHTYAIPLWNLCRWRGDQPTDSFEFAIETAVVNQVSRSVLVGEELGLP